MSYEDSKPLLKAAVEGYVASSRGLFPPQNPYAPCGVWPGREEDNPLGAAWFFGYWERAYCKNGEEKVEIGEVARLQAAIRQHRDERGDDDSNKVDRSLYDVIE